MAPWQKTVLATLMQAITQILTKTWLLLFGPFTMLLEICMQMNSVLLALSRQINKQKVCEKIILFCADNEVFVKYQAQRRV